MNYIYILLVLLIITYLIFRKRLNEKISNFKHLTFLGFVILNLLGNTIPVWFILLINLIEKGTSKKVVIESIHQPFTILVLGGTLLSTTLFLWRKELSFSTKKDKNIPTTMLIYIFISLPLFGYLFMKTYNMRNEEVPYNMCLTIYLISSFAFIYYLYYQFKDFNIINIGNETSSVNIKKESDDNFNDLKDSFNKIKDDE